MTKWTRGLALGIGLGLAVVLPEILYRILRVPALSPTTSPTFVQHDDVLGWTLRAGTRARHRSEEFDVEIAVNAQGFRGPDWPAEKKGRRVLVLGDSLAFGWGVEHGETFGALIGIDHPDWEVLNAGVSGYGTDQELLLLRSLLPSARPDVVLCVFCSNDLWESAADVAYGHHKPRFVQRGSALELTGVPVPFPWHERMSALWRALLKRGSSGPRPATERDVEAEWELVSALFRSMRDELDGVPLVIVSEEEHLAQLAEKEAGIRHVDLRPLLARAARPGLVLAFESDGHWNTRGHDAVAQLVTPFLAPGSDQR